MMLPVLVRPRAEQQLLEIAKWWAENRSTEQADQWLTGIVDGIKSLADSADKCPLASESTGLPFEVRELRFGLSSRPTHRVLFTIREDCVYVILIRHLAQRPIDIEDL